MQEISKDSLCPNIQANDVQSTVHHNLLPTIKLDMTGVDSIFSQTALERFFHTTSLRIGWKTTGAQEVLILYCPAFCLFFFPSFGFGWRTLRVSFPLLQ